MDLFHPADCMGSIGAASIPILINMGVEHLKKKDKTLCLFASDDFGGRGAVILQKITENK